MTALFNITIKPKKTKKGKLSWVDEKGNVYFLKRNFRAKFKGNPVIVVSMDFEDKVNNQTVIKIKYLNEETLVNELTDFNDSFIETTVNVKEVSSNGINVT